MLVVGRAGGPPEEKEEEEEGDLLDGCRVRHCLHGPGALTPASEHNGIIYHAAGHSVPRLGEHVMDPST